MAGTQVRQIREPVSTDEGTKYQITATCLIAGTLPDTSIFLFEVVQDEDPKNDAFTRVVDPADFTDYGTNRDASITDNTRLYRAAQLILTYESITDANSARLELTARISAIVNAYDAYITAFLTIPEGQVVIYPTVDESEKTALIEQYELAAAAVGDLETERDNENLACQALVREYEVAQERLVEAQSDYATLVGITGPLAAGLGVFSSLIPLCAGLVQQATSLIALSSASSGDKATHGAYMQALTAHFNSLSNATTSLVNNAQTPLLTLVGTLQSRVSELQAEVLSKQQEVNDCHLELATLQANVDAARTARDNALAAVRAVCPDYVPTV